ncbi:hypothetical protein DXG03_000287 [Asterophora parasitica]|uniref:N-acetyltransferase domain-containing protein n=1 Tax=Asterophora parasitica TaxID=117018 RepID=A0A9P7GF67_9AGAR|nr:hypothetical protein DXG03_000287 [Asterophora parasitica]
MTNPREGYYPTGYQRQIMSPSIRKATEADEAALSRICLLTADAGVSAESLHDYPELPGLTYSVPYVKLPTTWAFVLVDGDAVIGYIVGSKDTRAYEKYAEDWWLGLAAKYPVSLASKPADEQYMKKFTNMHTASDALINFAAAHLHINILDGYQGQGWGKRLITTAIEYLKGEEVEGKGIWLGLDPRNLKAKAFYERLGFRAIEGAAENELGVRFADYRG